MPRLRHGVVSRHGDALGANHPPHFQAVTETEDENRWRRSRMYFTEVDARWRDGSFANVCVCVCVCALARWLPLFVFQLCVSLHVSNLFQASFRRAQRNPIPVPSSVLIGPRQNKIDAPPCDRPPPHHGTGTADCRVPPWTVHGPTFVGQCIGLTIKLYTKTAMPYEVWGSGAAVGPLEGALHSSCSWARHGCGTGALGRSYPMAAAKEGVGKPCGRFLSLAGPLADPERVQLLSTGYPLGLTRAG